MRAPARERERGEYFVFVCERVVSYAASVGAAIIHFGVQFWLAHFKTVFI